MSFDPHEPLDAILLPDQHELPHRTGRRVWVVVGIFGFLLFSAIFIGGVTSFTLLYSRDDTVIAWRSAEQRRAALIAAFDGQRREIRDADRPEIEQLLADAASTSRQADAQGFRRLVDFDRLVQRIATYPGQGKITPLEQSVLKYRLRQDVDGVGDVEHFELVQLERPSPDQAIAYVYAFNDEIRGDPYRFLLCRTKDGWRIQDWERIESGWSHAEQYARAYAAADRHNLDGYGKVWDQLEEVEAMIEAGELTEASERLPSIARLRVPPSLSPMSQWRIALVYSHLGEWDECLRICRLADHSAGIPGIFSLEATCLNLLERHEEALAAVENFELRAGFHADIVELKAGSLSALGRDEEAIECRRRLARFLPDDMDLLSSYIESLPSERKAELVEVLQEADDPAATAVELADGWLYGEDENILRILQQFVRERAPDSLHTLVLDARVFEYMGQYDRAADCFRAAAERATDAEDKDGYWTSYLYAMAQDDRIVEGYLAVPDRRRALRVLSVDVEEYEGSISLDQLAPLLDIHRERFPDDRWLHFHTGALAGDKNDLQTAEREFGLAAASGNDELAYIAPYRHRDVLCRQGKLLEAYRAYPDDPAAFTDLAAKCRGDRDADGLAAILEEHWQSHPDDPWIPYYDAVVKQLSGQEQQAWKMLDELAADPDTPCDNSRDYSVNLLRTELGVTLGKWQEMYAESETPERTFGYLARELRSRRDWRALSELCERHRVAFPEDRSWLTESVEIAKAQNDHSRVVQLLTPWPAELLETTYEAVALREQLAISLLRLGRVDEALERARQFAETDEDYFPWVVVLDHQRRWDELAKLLDGMTEDAREEYRYGDSQRLRILREDPEAAFLRQQVPLPLPEGDFAGRVVLLTAKPPSIDEDRLQQLHGDNGPLQIRSLPVAADDTAAAFEVSAPAGRVVIAAGSGAYSETRTDARFAKRHAELAKILQTHDGWLEIQGVEAADPGDRFSLEQVVGRLAAGLIEDGVLAVYSQDAGGASTRLAMADHETADVLRKAGPLEEAFRDAAVVYLPRREEPDESAGTATESQRRKALRSIAESLSNEEPSNHALGVRIQLGSAAETLWFRAIAAEHQGYGQYRWTGELLDDSRLWPQLKASERLVIHSHQISQWQSR